MDPRPTIKDATGDFSGDCVCKPGLKSLHRIHRTLPFEVRDNSAQEVLQDEDGFAILDEQTAGFIFDDLK